MWTLSKFTLILVIIILKEEELSNYCFFFLFDLTSNINDYLLLSMFFLTLYQLLAGYQTREQAIKRCINTVNENTQQLRERRDKNPDDYYAMRDLRKEQTKVRIVVHHFTRMQQLIYNYFCNKLQCVLMFFLPLFFLPSTIVLHSSLLFTK